MNLVSNNCFNSSAYKQLNTNLMGDQSTMANRGGVALIATDSITATIFKWTRK